jgi:hypothetical protein
MSAQRIHSPNPYCLHPLFPSTVPPHFLKTAAMLPGLFTTTTTTTTTLYTSYSIMHHSTCPIHSCPFNAKSTRFPLPKRRTS